MRGHLVVRRDAEADIVMSICVAISSTCATKLLSQTFWNAAASVDDR